MCAGIHVIKWPPFSPDLNPIETVWDWLKDYIATIDPSIHRSYIKLKRVVRQAWDVISNERVLESVSGESMRARCQAVIDANEMNTKVLPDFPTGFPPHFNSDFLNILLTS